MKEKTKVSHRQLANVKVTVCLRGTLQLSVWQFWFQCPRRLLPAHHVYHTTILTVLFVDLETFLIFWSSFSLSIVEFTSLIIYLANIGTLSILMKVWARKRHRESLSPILKKDCAPSWWKSAPRGEMDTTDDMYGSVPEMIANLDLYGLVEDLAQNPGTQNQRVKVSMRIPHLADF